MVAHIHECRAVGRRRHPPKLKTKRKKPSRLPRLLSCELYESKQTYNELICDTFFAHDVEQNKNEIKPVHLRCGYLPLDSHSAAVIVFAVDFPIPFYAIRRVDCFACQMETSSRNNQVIPFDMNASDARRHKRSCSTTTLHTPTSICNPLIVCALCECLYNK